MAAKKLSFEEKLSRLEEIVAALEKGDAPLADSLRLFDEGTKLVNACSTELDKAEQGQGRIFVGLCGKALGDQVVPVPDNGQADEGA